MRFRRTICRTVSSAVALMLGSGALAGESGTEDTAQPDAESAGLNEIIVTARKRDERLIDVPISVTALSGTDIEVMNIRDLQDFTHYVPNLEINNGRVDAGRSSAQIYIRGVGQNDFLFPNDPGVGLYVDDVYVSRSIGGVVGVTDVDQVEVLRGPQGTLYGKNTIGGAVKITSRLPTGEYGGTGDLTYGSYNRLDARLSVDFPIVPTLDARITASSRNAGDIGDRPQDVTGQGNGNVDENAVRAILRWRPTDGTDVVWSTDYTRQRQHSGLGTLIATVPSGAIDLWNQLVAPTMAERLGLPPDTTFGSQWIGSRRVSNATTNNLDDLDVWGTSLKATFQLSDSVTLKSITAFRNVRSDVGRDGDHSPLPILQTIINEDDSSTSEELQLSGISFNKRLNWFFGAYFLHDDLHNAYVDTQLLDGFYPIAGIAALDLDVKSNTSLKGNSSALYGSATYSLTDQLSLTAGGRYTRESKKYYMVWGFPATENWIVGQPGEPNLSKDTWKVFTPDVKLSYKFSDDLNAYASYSKGFKAGGWNPRPFAPAEYSEYAPEHLTAYEVGLKSQFWNRRASLNVAAFYSDYRDIQLTSVTERPDGTVAPVVENAGRAHIYGSEVEFAAKATQTVTTQLGIGFIDAKYVELDPGVSFYDPGLTARLPDTPRWTANGALIYATDMPGGGHVNLRLDATYKSRIYKDPDNTPQLIQGGYTLLDARASYRPQGARWEAALFGTNLTDKTYLTNGVIVSSFGMVEGYFGRPREFGVSLKYDFQ